MAASLDTEQMDVPSPRLASISQVAEALYGRPWTGSTHGAGNGAWGQRVGGGTQPTWANSINPDSPHPRGLVGMPTWKGVFGGFCKRRHGRRGRLIGSPEPYVPRLAGLSFRAYYFSYPTLSLPSRAQETIANILAGFSRVK